MGQGRSVISGWVIGTALFNYDFGVNLLINLQLFTRFNVYPHPMQATMNTLHYAYAYCAPVVSLNYGPPGYKYVTYVNYVGGVAKLLQVWMYFQ